MRKIRDGFRVGCLAGSLGAFFCLPATATAAVPAAMPAAVAPLKKAGFFAAPQAPGKAITQTHPPSKAPEVNHEFTAPHGAPHVVVLEDKPGSLILEITASQFEIAPGSSGQRILCDGCQQIDHPGAPDLPVYRFDVLCGPASPNVQLTLLQTENRPVLAGVAASPRFLDPNHAEYVPDAALFKQAAGLAARLMPERVLRSAPVRGIEVPLALWSETGKTLTLIRRLRVQMTFTGMSAQPVPGGFPAAFRSAVKNPVGGAYLYKASRNALRKTASAPNPLGNRYYAFKIGDRILDNFDEDRLYAISYSDLLRAGNDIVGASPGSLRMYCGPNDTVPRQMTGEIVPGRLQEIPIDVLDKNGNGTFDEGDSIRFYGHGTSVWKAMHDSSHIGYDFSADPYSFENYYYLDFSGNAGSENAMRLSERSLPVTPRVQSVAYAYLRAEKNLQTGGCDASRHKDEEAGFDWFWYWKSRCETYTDTVITLTGGQLQNDETDSLPDVDSLSGASPVFVKVQVRDADGISQYTVYYGGKGDTLEPVSLDSLGIPIGTVLARTKPLVRPPEFHLDSLIWRSGHRFQGYTLAYPRKLKFTGKPLRIFPSQYGRPVTYQVEGGTGLNVLRIDKGVATVRFMLDNDGRFTDSLGNDADAQYYVYTSAASFPPGNLTAVGKVTPKTAINNLATGDGVNPEYLIIAPAALLDQAVKLRDYRNDSHRALHVKTAIVLIEDIYREYSGGRMSPIAIRDFLRWAYSQWGGRPMGQNPLRYVLLFGDGNFDYRGIKASFLPSPPPNLIPPFEYYPRGSGEEIAAEDFYAALDSSDNDLGNAALDVSIGRLPLQTTAEAEAYLQKVSEYEDPAKSGDWRGRTTWAADDGTQRGAPGDLDPIRDGHTTDSDRLANTVAKNEPATSEDKIYLLDYPLNSSFHKPEAAQDLLSLINRGTLMVNYVGHGASNQWADEVLLQTSDALSRMHNQGKTPMVNAFSCTVGRFESLTSEGMSEQFVKQPLIGAIGAISATRESFPQQNIALALAFYGRVFPIDTSTDIVTVGQALMDAKNSSETPDGIYNDPKYALLGEPVLLLRKPPLSIAFTQAPDTLKALDCRSITGTITGGTGDGFVNLKIIAGSVHKVYELPPGMVAQQVDKRGNILFERTFPYHDYKFSTDYFIPKQISFGDTNAMITAFAWDAREEREGTRAIQNLHIQGTANSACAVDKDGTGPTIQITGCQPKETGNVDFPNRVKLSIPYCLQIGVRDSTGGVLTAEGPDEGTTLEIPGSVDPFHPQPGVDELYYKTYQYSLEKAVIRPGNHLLKVSARDGYGNVSTRQLQMEVTTDSSLNTVSAFNIPNPMKRNGTTFYFSTVIPSPDLSYGDAVDTTDRVGFEIRIFNQSGLLVRVFQGAHSGATSWDGRDQWGQLLGNGVYFYQVIARQSTSSLAGSRPGFRTLSSRRNTLIISR